MDAKKVLTSMLGLPDTATEEECGRAMAKLAEDFTPADWRETLVEAFNLRGQLRPQLRPATRGQTFTEVVDALVVSEKLSYGDAARRVARQQPELYERHRQASMLGNEPAGARL